MKIHMQCVYDTDSLTLEFQSMGHKVHKPEKNLSNTCLLEIFPLSYWSSPMIGYTKKVHNHLYYSTIEDLC